MRDLVSQLLLGVHADHRLASGQVRGGLVVEVGELLIPVRMLAALHGLGVGLEAETLGPQQLGDRLLADPMTHTPLSDTGTQIEWLFTDAPLVLGVVDSVAFRVLHDGPNQHDQIIGGTFQGSHDGEMHPGLGGECDRDAVPSPKRVRSAQSRNWVL